MQARMRQAWSCPLVIDMACGSDGRMNGALMDDEGRQWMQRAIEARQQGRSADARELLETFLRRFSGEPQALNLLGMLALEEGAFAHACRHFAAAAAADPTEPALWMNLASAHRGARDAEGERAALHQAIALDQRNFMAQLRMAQLYQRTGDMHEAADSWGKVLSLASGMADLPQPLAHTLDEARQFVVAYKSKFATRIEAGVAGLLAEATTTDKRRFQACLDAEFGRRTIFRNECSGLHYPFLPADEFFDRHHFPWMPELEAKTDMIRSEFLAMVEQDRGAIRPYVRQDAGTPENKWTALNGSLDWGAAFLWEYGVRNEAVCAACPATVAALEALPRADIPGRAPSAFFSLLKPGSTIPAHTGVTNTRAIVHLPLIVPPGCFFRVGGETRQWQEGMAFAFDDTIDHEAWNESDHLRVVLIFDVWNPHLSLAEQEMLKQFYATADASKTKDNSPRI